MKIFTSTDIHEIDRLTIERKGITSWELMEKAASLITDEITKRWLPSQRIIIFAGPGNNGGDALAIARMLINQGYSPDVLLFNTKGKLSNDCQKNRDLLLETGYEKITEIIDNMTFPDIKESDVIIDGLFGSGLSSKLNGGYKMVIRNINESKAFVVSIDIPSGLFGEFNADNSRRDIIHADLTFSFQFPRLSFFFNENTECLGEWEVLDIGLDRDAIKSIPSNIFLIDATGVRDALKTRNPFSDKNDYGRIYIAAGSIGMVGAAILTSRAAMRTGTGVVTVHTPNCGYIAMQTAVPEAIVECDDDNCNITSITPHPKSAAIAIGPGLGKDDKTVIALEKFLQRSRKPVILDADALNCICAKPIILNDIPEQSVITPNNSEFDRLFGDCYSDEERMKKALDISAKKKIIVVIKGNFTKVIRPDGKIFINSTGNPGMATAGSGDVLTGIIASLIGQGFSSSTAASMGVFIHGLAGDMARKRHGEYGMIASDIVDNIGKAIKLIMES